MPTDFLKDTADLPGEFSRIERYFAPLTRLWGAFKLLDDAAALKIPQGKELIVTNDSVVAGVHYRGDESGARVAQKLMRRNLSDLAAMGAEPLAYNLSFAVPRETTEEWIKSFTEGLAHDQKKFGWSLIGGDSVAVPHTAILGMTALGLVPLDKVILRSKAQLEDDIYCSGTIGDGFVGLQVSRGAFPQLKASDRQFLIERYELPQPRITLGQSLRDIATAAIDISDGVVADLNHICRASKVGAIIESRLVPLSPSVIGVLSHEPLLFERILGGGDDYELIFTAPASLRERIAHLANELSLPLTRVGKVVSGTEVRVLDTEGRDIPIPDKGYTHFNSPKF